MNITTVGIDLAKDVITVYAQSGYRVGFAINSCRNQRASGSIAYTEQ